MNKSERTSQFGYSLIEILIVLAIMAILVTFAVMALGTSAESIERQNIAKGFKVALERARFDSIKRRATDCSKQARVEITGASSYSVITDQDQNDTIDLDYETAATDFTGRGNTEITSPDLSSLPIVFRFDERGQATSGPCDAPTAVVSSVRFCQMPCTTPGVDNSSLIFISSTGTSAFLSGDSAVPSFDDPTIANVSNPMNPLTAVWDMMTNTNSGNGNGNTNGNTANGNTANGNTANGNTANGNTANGNTANGNTSNGNTANGNTSNGNTANGNTSNGNTSNGNTAPTYCGNNQPPVGCVCSPDQHLQAGKCRRNH
jgi:prepilin-type N-terminal cleavage/methylation domain-containing protein